MDRLEFSSYVSILSLANCDRGKPIGDALEGEPPGEPP
jgi:hypothetical protein